MSNEPRRILVGTDFSTAASVAVTRAGRVAREGGDEVEVMHVVPLADVPVYRVAGWQANRHDVGAKARRQLESLALETRARFGVPVRIHVALGDPHTALAERSEATGARLVVVGAHGKRLIRDLFVGSTAQRMRRRLTAPLLIARNDSARTHVHALVAVDFSAASVDTARAVTRLFPDATIHFLHVCNAWFEARLSRAGVAPDVVLAYRNQVLLQATRELDDFLARNDLKGERRYAVVKRGDPASCIEETANELGVSLVALGVRGKSSVQAALLGSVSERVLSGVRHDVLLASAASPRPAMSCEPSVQPATLLSAARVCYKR